MEMRCIVGGGGGGGVALCLRLESGDGTDVWRL